MKKIELLVLVGLALSAPVSGYEFRTHHGITAAARRYLVGNSSAYGFDPDFLRLIKDSDDTGPGYGDLIDSRAGDPENDAWVDEDHEEGYLRHQRDTWCEYEEIPCAHWNRGAMCTRDHFHPPFPLVSVLGGVDAVQHAHRYTNLAYRFYMAAKCQTSPAQKEKYFRWAAMAVGHGLWSAGLSPRGRVAR